MLQRRRSIISVGGPRLPYDAEVEYLESTGIQYIDTGYLQRTRNFELRLRMQWTGDTDSQFESFWAYMARNGTEPRSGLHKYQGKWMFGTNATQSTGVAVDSNVHEFFVTGNASAQREYLYMDGTQIGVAITTGNQIAGNPIPFYIFCRNRNGSIDNWSSMRLMSANYKVFSEASHTTLAHEIDYIPVRIGTTGYMFDKVSWQLFGNAGTGAFTVGPDKS